MWGVFKKPVITDELRVNELLTRGVAEVIETDALRKKLLSGERLTIKLGIDPTSPNLHVGRSIPLLKLRDFQELGHEIVLIIGDFTGVIGDTSDKESERPMLDQKTVAENMRTYAEQAGKILDMRQVTLKKNSEWLGKLSYADIGQQADAFSVADFTARDNIKRRLEAGSRVSLREMLYPLMQGYDSVAIEADVEIGGTDQRFNLLAGRKLQEVYGQEPQQILTTNLIEGIDGRKMSSSWGNTINFTDEPEDMFGKVMRLPDELIETYFIHTTRVPLVEVSALLEGGPKEAKEALAEALVTLYHGEGAAKAAHEHFVHTFQEGGIPDARTVSADPDALLVDIALREGIVASKKEFARLVADGAVEQLDAGAKVTDLRAVLSSTGSGTYRFGKRRFLKIEMAS